MEQLKNIRTEIDQLRGQQEALLALKKEAEQTLQDLIKENETINNARFIAQEVALATQKQLKISIEPIVTTALDIVFKDEAYGFSVEFEIKNNKTECSLYFTKNGINFRPLSSSGFGAVDVAAFALRLALWNISKPVTRSSFLLDEPFKHVSEDLQEAVMEMVHTLSRDLGLQIILITHTKESDTFEYSDRLFRVSINPQGVSSVKIIKDSP